MFVLKTLGHFHVEVQVIMCDDVGVPFLLGLKWDLADRGVCKFA